MKSVKKMVYVACLLSVSIPAMAQFSMPKVPGIGGDSKTSASQADPAQVKALIQASITSLNSANEKYAKALGLDKEAAEAADIALKLSQGTLGADQIHAETEISKSIEVKMKEMASKKETLSAEGKKQATDGMADHVKGTVGGVVAGKKLGDAIKTPSPSTISTLGGLKDFPSLIGTWASGTANIFQFLSSNGIDTKDAQSAIEKGMKD
jgi:hypothetical protein